MITIAKAFTNVESQHTFNFSISASNSFSSKILVSSVDVFVLVENRRPMQILFPTDDDNSVYVSENYPTGYPVAKIELMDSEKSTFKYAISAGNDDDLFAVDSETGSVIVQGTLTSGTVHQLTLEVVDELEPQSAVYAKLYVYVNDSVASPTSFAAWTGTKERMVLVAGIACGVGLLLAIVVTVAVLSAKMRCRRRKKDYVCRRKSAGRRRRRRGNRPN